MAKKAMKISPEEAARILKEETVLEIDTSKEKPLRNVRDHFYGLKKNPEGVRPDSPEGVVLFNLCICYKNNGNIQEGQIADVMYGFNQSGIPRNITLEGFKKLHGLMYINCTDENNRYVFGEPKPELYYKWTSKFYECLADTPKEAGIEVETRIEDTTVNKLEDK